MCLGTVPEMTKTLSYLEGREQGDKNRKKVVGVAGVGKDRSGSFVSFVLTLMMWEPL